MLGTKGAVAAGEAAKMNEIEALAGTEAFDILCCSGGDRTLQREQPFDAECRIIKIAAPITIAKSTIFVLLMGKKRSN